MDDDKDKFITEKIIKIRLWFKKIFVDLHEL